MERETEMVRLNCGHSMQVFKDWKDAIFCTECGRHMPRSFSNLGAYAILNEETNEIIEGGYRTAMGAGEGKARQPWQGRDKLIIVRTCAKHPETIAWKCEECRPRSATDDLVKQKKQLIKKVDITNQLLKYYSEVPYEKALHAAHRFVISDEMTDDIWATLAKKDGHTPPSDEVKGMVIKELLDRMRLIVIEPDGTEFDELP